MQNNAAKTIIFFSLHYPFHVSDSYLDKEIDLIAPHFRKVLIISSNTFTPERRATPVNATVYRFSPFNLKAGISALAMLFSTFFYVELYRLLFVYRKPLTPALLKEIFAFYGRALSTRKYIEQLVADEKIDTNNLLIYSYWMIESSFAAAMFKRKFPKVKVIARAHSLDVYFDRTTVKYHAFRAFILRQLDKLYFISEDAKEYFARVHAFTAEQMQKAKVSRIGIEPNAQLTDKQPTAVLRIISVGYIQKLKRVDLIIDALALMDRNIEWVHVGHSNHNEKDFVAIQQYAVSQLGNKQNIAYRFTGKTSKEELFGMYAANPFDVFLNVSETEGIPVSMMEAMSYSVPVIGTLVGGVGEIVTDGVNGFLLSAYPDKHEVKKALEKFALLSPETRSLLRKGAFDTWNTKYNAQVNNQWFVADVMQLFQ
ncbi:MAG TPA: glycosyltransferase [Chitinophagales bacterium]|nr:glycosyltransferase [Chitinophagales bacterium]